jgi:hypothetical protein
MTAHQNIGINCLIDTRHTKWTLQRLEKTMGHTRSPLEESGGLLQP